MKYTREKAKAVIISGSTNERLQLFFTEWEAMQTYREDTRVLDNELLGTLEDLIRDADNERFEYLMMAFYNISSSVMQLDTDRLRLMGEKERCLFVMTTWGMAETMETALNLVLANIEDTDKRKQLVEGLANHTEMYGCTFEQDNGSLVLDTKDKNLPTNLEKECKLAAATYRNYMEQYKSHYKAIMEFMETLGIKLDYIRQKIKADYDSCETTLSNIMPKYQLPTKSQHQDTDFPPVPTKTKSMLEKYGIMADWSSVKPNKSTVERYKRELAAE